MMCAPEETARTYRRTKESIGAEGSVIPRAGRTRAVIVEAATAEFLEKGFAAARIVSVARRAGCSTKTIYRLVADKPELFRIVAEDRIALYQALLKGGAPAQSTNEDALYELVRSFSRMVLSEETCRTVKLILAEHESFPGVAESYRQAVERMGAVLDARIEGLVAAGVLNWTDPQGVSEMLRLLVAGAQKQILLGLRDPMSDDAARTFADRCTRLLLRGASGF